MTRNYKFDWEIAERTEPLTKRDVRALTQGHRVRNGGGDGAFVVESIASSNEYAVDLRRGACDCPDADGDGGTICKHQRAAQFATGMRPIPTDALRLDEIAVDVIRDGDNDVVDLDAVDDYAQIRLETDDSVTRTPRWATDDGEIVETVQSEPKPPSVGAELDAEREMVERNAEERHALDGGESEPATCGAQCRDGSDCENPVGDHDRCHLHRDDEPEQVQSEPAADAIGLETDDATALANAATDGGAVQIDADGDGDVLERVLAIADDRPIIVVVN
ncbi:hypothetical protein [Natrinema sp. 1APR25-10V2]|uniref:hypothetical protein n=1 Tax=Natrinema sp. 1APR25-10V2 TaxID=2951081 RepID=UPI0028756EAC|nr:hypothetical protein [Natrinema sp. 1APR25-10V2]MDS0477909.1 hypothetical protein [Natrinema sp. 1APR25-10V2]